MEKKEGNQIAATTIERVHFVVYVIMVSALLFVFYCGLVGFFGWPLYIALLLLSIEGGVLVINKGQCPVTNLAKKYGAEKGYVFNKLFSEQAARYMLTLYVFIFIISLLLLAQKLLAV